MGKFFNEIFQDERGRFSSNRFVGIVGAMTLCVSLAYSIFISPEPITSSALIQAVAALSFGALGLGAANKIFKKGGDHHEPDSENSDEETPS